jgi:hypothetical protein
MCVASQTALQNIADPLKLNRGSSATIADPLNLRNRTSLKLGADGLPVSPEAPEAHKPFNGSLTIGAPKTSSLTGMQVQ